MSKYLSCNTSTFLRESGPTFFLDSFHSSGVVVARELKTNWNQMLTNGSSMMTWQEALLGHGDTGNANRHRTVLAPSTDNA